MTDGLLGLCPGQPGLHRCNIHPLVDFRPTSLEGHDMYAP
jgi:hypothetical protein